jgi:hypothetical protein
MQMNVAVVVRVRPVLASKGEESKGINAYVNVKSDAQQLTTGFGPRMKTHTYTNTFGPQTSQSDFFSAVGKPALDDLWQGMNATILAYGPRGSGKRFTTFGSKKDEGLIPRMSNELFQRLTTATKSGEGSFKMEFSFFESYCEKCNDLLQPNQRDLPISYIDNVGYHASSLTRCPVADNTTLSQLLEAALTARAVSAISTNTDTTQSHTFFQLVLTRTSVDKSTMKAVETTATLLIADLGDAGGGDAERAAATNTSNHSPGNSHSALRSVVKQLLKKNQNTQQAKFQSSQLTQILREALNGNSKTTLLVALPPTDVDKDTTDATLLFINEFKKLRTKCISNIDGNMRTMNNIQDAQNALRTTLAGTSSKDSSYVGIQQELKNCDDLLATMKVDWSLKNTQIMPLVQKALDVVQFSEIHTKKLSLPYLSNISNDPMINGRVIHFLMPGKTQIGAASGSELTSFIYGKYNSGIDENKSIKMMGLSIDASHCAITNEGDSLTLINMSQHTCVSGDALHPSDQHALSHGDWVVFGKTFDRHVYEVVIPTKGDKSSVSADWSTVIEAMCVQQLHGLQRQQKLAGMRPAASLGLKNRVLQIIPSIDEANFLAKELARPKQFDINVIASSDGHRGAGRRLSVGGGGDAPSHTGLSLEVIVQEVNNANDANSDSGSANKGGATAATWPEHKFLERSFGMRTMHMEYVTTFSGHIGELNKKYPLSKDPFYDPPQDVLIGTAVAYLNPLSYVIAIDQPLTILDQRGSAEGELLINMKPVVYRDGDENNQVDTDDENEPRLENFIGSTLHIYLEIQGARHIDISKTDGVYVEFRFLDEEIDIKTLPSTDVDNENPTLSYKKMYEFDITQELIQQVSEDVIEFNVMCKGNEKNQISSAPRLGFLSDVGDGGAVKSFSSPRGNKAAGGRRGGSKSGGGMKTDALLPGGDLGGGFGDGNYGSAVDAHKSELEKAAMRQRIAELEDQLANAESKSKACVLL